MSSSSFSFYQTKTARRRERNREEERERCTVMGSTARYGRWENTTVEVNGQI